MNQKYEKLKTLLKELFQLDQPDLDFGLYRIMHAKSAEVTQFLDKELLPQVQAAFGQYKSADKAEIERELAKVVAGIEAAGMDPAQSPKVKELLARIESEAVDVGALEIEVYDHLYSFFRRYYADGDFVAKRVYKPGVYAIPYEGEEVTLHWANKDQYYIKTSEYLRDYAFRLRSDDDANPMRVHFRLVDAAEGEHGNVKAAGRGAERRFRLAPEQPVSMDSGELVVWFTYKVDKSKQTELNATAEATVLAECATSFAEWMVELGRLAPTEKDPNRTVLAKHLKKYSDVNSFDYFIHKDLSRFLRRELDFFIKNEVLHLDDVENESAPRVEQYLSKVKIVRHTASKVIEFLAQLEDFQKKLWLKKKYVIETHWCIRIGCIPASFHAEIARNEAQLGEWVTLHAIDEVVGDLAAPGYSTLLTTEFFAAHPTLMVDTRHFEHEFTERLLDAIDSLDDAVDGVLFHGDNFQALSLMQARYRARVRTTYIDPPYNTGDDGFPYKDSYQHSSWLSMLADRLELGRRLEDELATVTVSIDDTELHRLCDCLAATYGNPEIAKLVWDKNRKNDARYFSVGHEYMVVAARDLDALERAKMRFREPVDGLEAARKFYAGLLKRYGEDWDEIRREWLGWFDTTTVADPRRRLMRFSKVGPRGPFRDDGNINWPGGGGPRYPILHPTTQKPCKMPVSGWRYPTPERFWEEYTDGRISFGADGSTVPSVISYLFDGDGQVMPSVHYSYAQTSAQEFDALFGKRVFDNPKNWRDIKRILAYLGSPSSTALDYFAGSGTTGHAVINLNREDGGRRQFILAEMAEYFDSVLLARLKKVTYTPEWEGGKPKRFATASEVERSPAHPESPPPRIIRRHAQQSRHPSHANRSSSCSPRPTHKVPAGSRSSTCCATCSTSKRAAVSRCSMCRRSLTPPYTHSRSNAPAPTKAAKPA
jgi:adenine-specific DNA-methyltransferase